MILILQNNLQQDIQGTKGDLTDTNRDINGTNDKLLQIQSGTQDSIDKVSELSLTASKCGGLSIRIMTYFYEVFGKIYLYRSLFVLDVLYLKKLSTKTSTLNELHVFVPGKFA